VSSIPFENSYARLPERFFARIPPTPVGAPRLLRLNHSLARELGLDPVELASAAGLAMLAGNEVPPGADPLAMAYAGFQFGNWVPQLGDGRAILLGEVIDRDGVRRDIQLKGSGPTPFSRRGDGRAALGPVLREYIVSEAMAALGIPTTRSLAAVASGETVLRESALPGAVLTRVARSHVRVGTFQFFAGRQDVEGLRTLADYVIERHYAREAAAAENRDLGLLRGVIEAQADLIARWQLVGFIHGVMNTDNMSIAGETIDYGPCAFMDAYHPETVYSSIDRMGRYAYQNQPGIGHWNLVRLAEALLPILGSESEEEIEQVNTVLAVFLDRFESSYRSGLGRKLGLVERREGDDALADDLFVRMAENGADFTLTFRRLANEISESSALEGESVRSLFERPEAFDEWAVGWRRRLAEEGRIEAEITAGMLAVNPVYIPRNHLVEEVIRAAVDRDDLEPFERLLEVAASPFVETPGNERYAAPPRPEEIVRETFCGT
jgi:uncharacterized protein YdiU (UPF0061 family)